MPSAPWVTNNKAFSSPWSILVCWNLNVKYFEMECPVGFDFQEVYEYEWHGHCLFEDELFSMLWMWIHMRWSCFGVFFPFSFFFCFFYLYIYTHTYIYTCTPVYICVYIAIARAEGLRDSEGRKDENGRESKRKNVFKND